MGRGDFGCKGPWLLSCGDDTGGQAGGRETPEQLLGDAPSSAERGRGRRLTALGRRLEVGPTAAAATELYVTFEKTRRWKVTPGSFSLMKGKCPKGGAGLVTGNERFGHPPAFWLKRPPWHSAIPSAVSVAANNGTAFFLKKDH